MFTNEMSYNEDTIELWKTQTYRRKVIDDMSNNKDTVGSLEQTHIKMLIIDTLPNIKDTVFISVKHKIKNDDHRSSVEH